MMTLPPTHRMRPAETTDRQGIADLRSILGSTTSDGASWPPDEMLRNGETKTWLAMRDDQIVGVGIAWRNALHPHRRRISLGVHPDHRRQGIARSLWDRLGADPNLDWQTAVDSTNLAGRALLAQLGFGQLMRTHLARHRPSGDHPRWGPLPKGWQLVVLTEAPSAMRDAQALARLHSDIYAEQHTWNPPRAFSDTETLDLFVRRPGGELLPENTVLALRHGVALGIASLRGDPASGTLELGWTGVLAHGGNSGAGLTVALTDWCLNRAAELGVDLEIEVDDANAPVLEALGAWDIVWDVEWLTFARDRGPTDDPGRSIQRR